MNEACRTAREVWVAAAFFVAVAVAGGESAAGITVTENSVERLSFTFELTGLRLDPIASPEGRYVVVGFDGANTDVGNAGEPVFPATAVLVGVPLEGAVRVRFLPLETRNVTLDAPVYRRAATYRSEGGGGFEGGSWISEVRYGTMRGYRVADVLIKPFIYDESSGRLTICTRGVCTFELPPAKQIGGENIPRGSEFAAVMRRTLLNYETARRWRTASPRSLSKAVTAAALPASGSYRTFVIGDGSSGRNEATTDENGVVKIPGNLILSAFGAGKTFASFQLLASLPTMLPSSTPSVGEIPSGTIPVPFLPVDVDGDGRLDAEDYLLVYATGASDWHFDTVSGQFTFDLNHYDDYRHYWLRYVPSGAGSFIEPFAGPRQYSGDTLTHFLNRVLLKDPNDLPRKAEGGTEWRWALLVGGRPYTIPLQIPDAVSAMGGELRIHKASIYGRNPTVTLGGSSLCSPCMTESWLPVADWADQSIVLSLNNVTDTFELEAVELKYHVALDMSTTDRLLVLSERDTGLAAYRLSNLPDRRVYIFRIPPDESAITLLAEIPAQHGSFTWVDTGGIGVKYWVGSESAIASVQLPSYSRPGDRGVAVRNLRAHADSVDYLIVTSAQLADEAQRLAEHKKATGRFRHPKVVETEDIYREFSGGNRDITAIRNFLVYAAHRWGAGPDYVILFGGGHYDYKGYGRTLEPNHVPPPQVREDCIEDFYVYLDSAESAIDSKSLPDAIVGRIPARSASEARVIVDKIIEMESDEADWGDWRNRILFVADDDMQGPKSDPIRPHHYVSSGKVEDEAMRRRDFLEMSKIYLYEFERDALLEKPAANRALVNAFNGGVAYVNYFGHGAEQLWADEHVFTNEDVGALRNRKRYPVVTSFSCSVGRFDIPDHESFSDVIVRASASGAIASLASTRLAYANTNEPMAVSYYRYLFEPQSPASEGRSIGQALLAVKVLGRQNNTNVRVYALLGDPSIRFSSITDTVDFSVRNSAGESIDTLAALQTVTLSGRVMRNGAVNTSFGALDTAYVHLAVYNPEQDSVRRKDGGTNTNVLYTLPGTPVFVGRARVVKGRFEQKVLLPKRLTFGKTGAKAVAYAWEGGQAAGGLVDSLVFYGTAQGVIDDSEGPRIMVRPVIGDGSRPSLGYTDKVTVPLPMSLELGLYDESGIDVVGKGPDEGLTVELPPALSRANINHMFQFLDGDYRRGTAVLSFEKGALEKGVHTMVVTAQDLVGNISRLSVEVEVTAESGDEAEVVLDHVFTYPNPFRVGEKTRFFFHNTNAFNDEVATIHIYTLSGKLIKVIRGARDGEVWEGTDSFGRRLGPNAYLYRISLDVPSHAEPVESEIKKVVIHPRR